MVWFLPLIVIGGLFLPLLGYLVLGMMIFMFILSFFKGRYWCVYLCPRGSFLDQVLSKVSLKKNIPRLFTNKIFRLTVFSLFMGFFIFRLFRVEKTPYKIGFVFVQMCLLTTLIAIILGVGTKERAWCLICPMGTLQAKIASLNKKKK